MFKLAILIGIYSYLIFALGLLGILYRENIIFLTLIFFLIVFFIYKRFLSINSLKNFKKFKELHKLSVVFLALILLQAFVNLIGALGHELGFDALWYHLTLPKIYLINHSIDYISGGLLYYSAMPKLTEMLYIAGLAVGNEIFPKLIHFSFGILSLIALYKLSVRFLSIKWSFLACVIFYSNLVVGWQSITAYIDLARTFFEVMALWGFINWQEKEDKGWFVVSAIMLGLAISTKLLALGSLLIFPILIIFFFLQKKAKIKDLISNLFAYCFICILVSLPWFAFSYTHTGNLVHPFFTNTYPVNLSIDLINPIKFINDVWNIFTNSADPISPIYIIFLPIALFLYKKLPNKIKIICIYSVLSILIWYLIPRTGGGRFIMPYLPTFSILVVAIISIMKNESLKKTFIIFVIFIALFSLVYRFGANLKYIPVIVGIQSKSDFLSENLNFSFGDFYDTDGFFERNIKKSDKVLLYGFHNLYYIDFPFIDSSWVKKGDRFNFIAVQNSTLSSRFRSWRLIYYNSLTNVKVYSLEGKKWTY